MSNQPWYHEGLRFECTGCGDCCTGAPGYVWISPAETEAMARAMGMTVADFETKYVRPVGKRKSLIEFGNGDCVFFDGKSRQCRVYHARPAQCRTWPFWESNLRSPQTWRGVCKSCPGSGQGTWIPASRVEEQMAVVRV